LETARNHSEPNQGNGVGVPFQQLIFGPLTALQHLMSWSIVVVENPVVGQNLIPSSMHSFM
jgi:hypothetical protein